MKLKNEYNGKIIGRRINGRMIEFDTNKGFFEWFYKNGFEDLFEKEENKIVYFTNDSETQIIKESVSKPLKKKKYDTPNDKRVDDK